MSLIIKNLQFCYPNTTTGVHDINLTINNGELLAVIGSSGSGKTTLLNLIAGFLTAKSGSIFIDDTDITYLPVRERQLGVVFQSYALFPHMTIWENVAYPLKIRKIDKAKRRTMAYEALERVGLKGFGDRRPTTLSGGQQQRVALARALVFAPKVLLLDEPLSALDASMRSDMRDEILRLQREFDIATVHITHDQEEALSMADRVAVMQAGNLVQVAQPKELYDAPATKSVAGFVGEANLWDGIVRSADTVELPFGVLRTTPHNLAAGTKVTALVRPENVLTAQSPDGTNQFGGNIIRDRFLGAMRRYDLAVGDSVILGQTGERTAIESVYIAPEHVRLLTA
ncbi:ABC transporter ATP-binding protein [Oleidesulfovibrio sp.]|uniref:ABC transporter ATP-binding protein n=1 Tax=Oleidesulfovibrio sp. TaxID=2909707 RepID=UPI003A848744